MSKISSTSSALVELAELRDAVEKLTKLNHRIEYRAKMQDSRDRQNGLALVPRGPVSKAELRRRAGLMPGRYPKHDEPGEDV